MNYGKDETAATIEPSQQPKKSKKPLIISLAVIVLLGISATVYALFFNLSAKETYFLAEKKTMEQTSEDYMEMFAVNEDINEKMLEEPSKTSMNLSLNSINGLEAIDPNVAMFSSFLNQVKLNFSTQLDPENNEGLVDMKVGIGGTELVKAEAYQSETVTGLSVPLLYNQYLYMKNEEFGKVMREMDPNYVGPDTIDNFVKLQLESVENQEKLEEHLKEYGKFILDEIKDEDVTSKDGVEFEGEKYEQLTLELSEKETKDLLKALITKVKNDDELLDQYIEMGVGSNFTTMSMNKEDMKKEFISLLEEAEKNMDDVSMPDGLKSVILIDNDNLIVKRDMMFKIGDQSEIINMNLSTHALRKDDIVTDGKWELNAYPEGSKNQDYLKILFELKGEKKDEKMNHDLTGTVAIAESGEVNGATLKAGLTGKPEDMKINFEISVDEATQQIPPIKGHFTRKVTDDLDNGQYSTKGEFGLEADPGLGSPVEVVFDYESKTAFKEKLKFPNVQEDGVNVAELNDQEKQELMTEVQSRIQGLMMNSPF
ncbi:DUF6583 family protein [Pseudalkalibacillus berkeleyi]|uniref:Uncharacterized protein n=1 Tax=Pseudalkalibacillus berkeleyi TaxID=1069813 RepID=A0ABS9H1C5_9BACL|nr:DUF6583 family protein [Pseudalkalibacillus berkeleyi]MCF6138797.1 hypothetical protein [Pseudalkalibacillus berkeleyi]